LGKDFCAFYNALVPHQAFQVMPDLGGLEYRQERLSRIVTALDVKRRELGHHRLEQVFVLGIKSRVFVIGYVNGHPDLFGCPVVVFLSAGHLPGPGVGEGFKLVRITRA